VQIRSERFEYSLQNPRTYPLLETTVASLVRWVATRQIGPWGASAQDPEYTIENGPPIFPRSTTTIFAPRRLRYQWV
jgi:hypothetical protein